MNSTMDKENKGVGTTTGLYLYCIVNNAEVPGRLWDIPGIDGKELIIVTHRDLSAVVSSSLVERQKASRENLTRHTLVLEKVMEHQQLLPVRFGIIGKSTDDIIENVLKTHYWDFLQLLEQLKDKKELGLKVFWNQDATMSEIATTDPQIRDLRDKLSGHTEDSTYYERINLGHLVESALITKREGLKNEILGALLPLSTDHRENKLLTETMVLNAAFLVPVENETSFDAALNEFEQRYKDELTIRYVAVAPPYNFVNIAIHF